MIRHHHGHVVVTGDNDEVVGFFTERDLLVRVLGAHLTPEEVPINEVMSSNLIKVESSASCRECINLMRASRCRHLLVFDHGVYQGVISLRDVASLINNGHKDIMAKTSKILVWGFVATVAGILFYLLTMIPAMLSIAERTNTP